MRAKHRLAGSRSQRRSLVYGAAPISILCAASFAAWVIDTEKPTAPEHVTSAIPAAAAPQPVSQEGILIAVSADSVTAISASGYIQTYFLTPDTTVVTGGSSHPVTATSYFMVNDAVDIVGTVHDGRTFATSLTNHNLGHGEGPPMDTIAS
ncbi:hypothetical protein [Mycobacterium montefiorense]|uniref:hypothetical protein n=1 Tax=Mycobacterium montefiorense TaxID=154654 RepID=UPI0021DE46DF|nr:hypothetical protein [Mycobacterium montefiorense]MCV7427147.1 hypothetical protein [Mycobacterium montefiorense]GLE53645.1 hypothetical protein ATCCBAA256_32080 [Mycobacterium montefiorense]